MTPDEQPQILSTQELLDQENEAAIMLNEKIGKITMDIERVENDLTNHPNSSARSTILEKLNILRQQLFSYQNKLDSVNRDTDILSNTLEGEQSLSNGGEDNQSEN